MMSNDVDLPEAVITNNTNIPCTTVICGTDSSGSNIQILILEESSNELSTTEIELRSDRTQENVRGYDVYNLNRVRFLIILSTIFSVLLILCNSSFFLYSIILVIYNLCLLLGRYIKSNNARIYIIFINLDIIYKLFIGIYLLTKLNGINALIIILIIVNIIINYNINIKLKDI